MKIKVDRRVIAIQEHCYLMCDEVPIRLCKYPCYSSIGTNESFRVTSGFGICLSSDYLYWGSMGIKTNKIRLWLR